MSDKKFRLPQKGSTLPRALILTAIVAVIFYYIALPAINIKSPGFFAFLFITSLLFAILYYLPSLNVQKIFPKAKIAVVPAPAGNYSNIPAIVVAVLLVLPLLVNFVGSSRLFHARAYSRILTVTEGSIEDIPSGERTNSIALMDTASAEKLGNREIGSLSGVVSQYNVSAYTQIDYKGTPVKTSPLKYDGFFKWWRNRTVGIPGYVIVNPVKMSADYVKLPEGMLYVPSAYFQKNLERHIRFRYPTILFDNLHFEIDEEGNPWYVASVYDHQVGLFGGKQVTGVILVNPVSGECQKLAIPDVPQWVDVVFPGDLICLQFNDSAQLHSGFLNSIFGQSGCRKVTEYAGEDEGDYYADFGYVSKGGDIWIYTGVTSLNNDSSNIGFILSNERTEETLFISCSGADEFSAMASAEGEVQEKRYTASFPSLILLDDIPTYIMVLKDASGLVKMYACVNVEQYNMVATAATQKECIAKYMALTAGRISQEEATSDGTIPSLVEEEVPDTSNWKTATIKIRKMKEIVKDGNSYLYLVSDEGDILYARYADVLGMLLAEEGDTLTILTDGERFALKE